MKKPDTPIVLIVFVVLLLPLSSCMHAVMMGGHDDHSEQVATAITKEVTNGDNILSVSIPPMTVAKEGAFSIALRSKSALPESVNVHYVISKKSDSTQASSHTHGNQISSKGDFEKIHQTIVMKNGSAAILFTATAVGEFVLSVEVERVPGSDVSLSTELSFVVNGKQSSGMGGMMGISSTHWYLGAAAMAGMMVAMLAVRGRMF